MSCCFHTLIKLYAELLARLKIVVVASSALSNHGEKYVRGSYSQNQILQKSRPVPSEPVMLDSEELYASAIAVSPLGSRPPIAYWNKLSGWGWSTGAMKEMAKQCRQAGVSFAAGQVNELIIENGDVRGARTKDGTMYRASKLVVLAAGSWSPAILPELAENLTATGQVLATLQLTPEEAERYTLTVSCWACLLCQTSNTKWDSYLFFLHSLFILTWNRVSTASHQIKTT